MDQFVRCLKMMEKRAHEEIKGSCILIFSRPDVSEACAQGKDPHSVPKMIQFCFEEKWFAIDVPSIHLSPGDAGRILKERHGFRREAEHPGTRVTRKARDLVKLAAVGKKYIYGDEWEAAEDVAYIFYTVWGLTPDAELLVTASAFDGPSWEQDVPLE